MTSTSSDDLAAKLDSIRDSLLVQQSLLEDMVSRLARLEAHIVQRGAEGTIDTGTDFAPPG